MDIDEDFIVDDAERDVREGSIQRECEYLTNLERNNAFTKDSGDESDIDVGSGDTEEIGNFNYLDVQRGEGQQYLRKGIVETGCSEDFGSEEEVGSKTSGARNEKFLSNIKLCAVVVVIAVIIPLVAYQSNISNKGPSNILSNRDNFIRNLKHARKDFPKQEDEFWNKVFHLIKYVNESTPTRPVAIVLLHDNEDVANCLVWRLGNAASSFFGTHNVIEVIGEPKMMSSDNEMIEEYRDALEKKAVMVVHRLDQIPGIVARSFHAFCDTYNPLVKRAVILFTLDDRYKIKHQNDTPTKRAMQVLKHLWQDALLENELNPLITRLTENVLEVCSEERIPC